MCWCSSLLKAIGLRLVFAFVTSTMTRNAAAFNAVTSLTTRNVSRHILALTSTDQTTFASGSLERSMEGNVTAVILKNATMDRNLTVTAAHVFALRTAIFMEANASGGKHL